MKLHFAILLLLFSFSFKVNAQPKAGDFLLGGSANFGRSTYYYLDTSYLSSNTYISARFSPELGIFITEKIVLSGFTNIIYYQNTNKQLIEDTLSNNKLEEYKSAHIFLSWGGAISYYQSIKKKLFWVNKLMYERGYFSDGVSFSSLVSKNGQTFNRQYYSIYTVQTGLQYFFKPYLSLHFSMNAISLYRPNKKYFNLTLLDKSSLSIGINFIIQSENE